MVSVIDVSKLEKRNWEKDDFYFVILTTLVTERLAKTTYTMRFRAILHIVLCLSFLQGQSQLERTGTPVSWSQSLTVNPDHQSLAQPDVQALLGEDAAIDEDRSAPFRFAYAREVDWNLDNSGTWMNLPNGDRLWLLGIEYNSAQSIAITLENLQLPKGGKLYVYSDDHHDYLGPITDEDNRSGELGLPHIKGQKIYAEYFEPNAFRGQSSFSITHVAGSYRNPVQDYQQNSACLELMTPGQVYPTLRNASASVMRVLLDHGQRYATGVLMNNSANDGTPYVLMSSKALIGDPSSYVFQFDVMGSGCFVPSGSCALRTICGATIKMNDANTEASLLELSKQPRNDWQAFYSGWRLDEGASDNYYCIQHAKGLPQTLATYSGAFMPLMHAGIWTQGLAVLEGGQTAAGSLGAPIFDNEGNLLGIFKGGSAHCGGNGGIDRFVLLDEIWSNVQSFLDPENEDQDKMPGYYQPEQLAVKSNTSDFLMYPNPSSDYVKLVVPTDDRIVSVDLFNAIGMNVKSWGAAATLTIDDLPRGIYTVRVSGSETQYVAPLFVTGEH